MDDNANLLSRDGKPVQTKLSEMEVDENGMLVRKSRLNAMGPSIRNKMMSRMHSIV